MWKRDEAVRPPQPASSPSPGAVPETITPRVDASRHSHSERDTVNIGKSVIIKGELSGSEDLTIEGQIEGKIELKQNVLTIGPNARIKAQVFAKTVVVQGEVHGNVTASERVEIRDSGSVDGDLSAPRVAISDGAHFRGSIDMQRTGEKVSAKPDMPKVGEKPAETRSATAPAPAVSVAAAAGSSGAPVR
jgi:cytoskeletal protein CcmA (bactofilin family)